jgi:fatty-acyl-CoA synthase
MTEIAPGVSILDADHVKEKAGSIGRGIFFMCRRTLALSLNPWMVPG